MTGYSQTFVVATGPLPDPKTLKTEQPSASIIENDPLIATGWQNSAYAGSALVLLSILVIVGIFSRKIEYVIGMALIMSVILIGCFLVVSF